MLPHPTTNEGVFDPEATKAMGDAFDRAKARIPHASPQEYIAIRIIEAAWAGERDVERLSAAGIGEHIGMDRAHRI
jgi:hypothetical protein